MNATLALALLIGAPALKDKSKPAPTIVGSWAVESVNVSGMATQPGSDKWTFNADGTRSIHSAGKEIHSSRFEIGAKDAANCLDFLATGNAQPTHLCRYKIEGDTLTLTVGHDKTIRPENLDPAAKATVWVFERIKE